MWLLVQDPAYFDDPTGEFPEFSEKNLKDIEKMIKKWVSTIRSKESAEDDEPVRVDTERMRELETTLGDTIPFRGQISCFNMEMQAAAYLWLHRFVL